MISRTAIVQEAGLLPVVLRVGVERVEDEPEIGNGVAEGELVTGSRIGHERPPLR